MKWIRVKLSQKWPRECQCCWIVENVLECGCDAEAELGFFLCGDDDLVAGWSLWGGRFVPVSDVLYWLPCKPPQPPKVKDEK